MLLLLFGRKVCSHAGNVRGVSSNYIWPSCLRSLSPLRSITATTPSKAISIKVTPLVATTSLTTSTLQLRRLSGLSTVFLPARSLARSLALINYHDDLVYRQQRAQV